MSEPHIGILLATFNGAANLDEQLSSLMNQTYVNWQLLAGDDGSTDGGRGIIEKFATQQKGKNNVTLLEGPRLGAAAHFLSLIKRVPDHLPEGSWLAFCDQDDVWLEDKLARGVNALDKIPGNTPALYCSRTWVVDSDLCRLRLSPSLRRPLGFRNALVQNVVAGNTILLNEAATRLLLSATQHVESVVMHDWWVYLLISGAGGCLIHDNEPTLLYRQHGSNAIGSNTGLRAKANRVKRMLLGDFRSWNDTNITALMNARRYLSRQAQSELDGFVMLRTATLWKRLLGLQELGLYRQTSAGTFALWVAVGLRLL